MSGHVRVTAVSGQDATNLQPALHVKKICKVVILCASVCECLWISRCVVLSRISGRMLWRCGAPPERETLHILTWPIRPKITHVDTEIRHRNKSVCGQNEFTYLVFMCSYTMSDNHPPPWGALACITHPTCNQVRQWLSEIALPTHSWVWWEAGLILWYIPDFLQI